MGAYKDKLKELYNTSTGYLGELAKSTGEKVSGIVGKVVDTVDKAVVAPVKNLFTPSGNTAYTDQLGGVGEGAGAPTTGSPVGGVAEGSGAPILEEVKPENPGTTGTEGGAVSGTDTGTEGGAGAVTETKPQNYSYSQYLADAEAALNESVSYLKALAESEKAAALEAADKEYQRASVDANAAYQRNLATYGAKAEALDRMGLSGSGYSDYLQGNAYSALRNDIGLATSEKNAAEQAAIKGYTNAIREADIYMNEKQMELNAANAEYTEAQRQENDAKKQALKSELMTMAQNGVSAEDLQDYINASGVSFTGEEIEALGKISERILGRMKTELVAQGLTSNMNAETIKAVAKANGITLSDEEINEYYKPALEAIRADIKTEEDKANALNIASLILSSENVDANTIKGLLELYGFDPTTGTGAALMSLAPEGTIVKTGYASSPGVVDSSNAGVIKADMKAEKAGSNAAGGNITVTYGGEKYRVQKVSENRIPEDDQIAVALTDSYRLNNNLSVEEWKRKEDSEIEGTVIKYGEQIYAYLVGKDGKYGWFRLEKRSAQKNKHEDTGYHKLMELFK